MNIKLFLCLFFFSTYSWPCKPTPGPHRTLQQNYSAAQLVLTGKIIEVSGEGLIRKIKIDVAKIYKGKAGNQIEALTSPNTCNPLGDYAKPGDQCAFIIDEKSHIMSGINVGVATDCAKNQTPEIIRDFNRDWDKQLSPLISR